jgi:hypothetical protein
MLRIHRMMECLAILPLLGLLDGGPRQAGPAKHSAVSLTSVAYRVHRTRAMVAFYTEAFGARFREVDARGIRSQFGEVGSLTAASTRRSGTPTATRLSSTARVDGRDGRDG